MMNTIWIGAARAAFFVVTFFVAGMVAADDAKRPTAADVRTAYDGGTQFVDVRSDSEWDDGHVKNALHLPVDQVDARAASVLPDKNTPLLLYCGTGKRAQMAAETLRGLGYTHVTAMTGGYKDLKAAGYPVVE